MTKIEKWRWRLGMEKEGLWKKILESKYGSSRTLNNSENGKKESRWWRDLRRIRSEAKQGKWFQNNIEWIIGNVNKIYFWHDRWVGEVMLAES